jgi:hypothetical protein
MEFIILLVGALSVIGAVLMCWRTWRLSQALDQTLSRIEVAQQQQAVRLQQALSSNQKAASSNASSRGENVSLDASLEKVHRMISDTSFDLIESVAPVEKSTQVLRKVHNATAREVYGSLRKINRWVGKPDKS